MVLPRQLVGRGSPPTSPIALLLAFRTGAPSGPPLRVLIIFTLFSVCPFLKFGVPKCREFYVDLKKEISIHSF